MPNFLLIYFIIYNLQIMTADADIKLRRKLRIRGR